MTVSWYKCQGDIWCELNKIDTNHKNLEDVEGVYIIWEGKNGSVLRVGFGLMKREIMRNKSDIAIQAFSHLGLFITWAEISENSQKGVYSYIVKTLKPKFIDIEPKLLVTRVNLPFGD